MTGNNDMFKKVLVANRGEIAVRIINTLKEMGITSVAIYSDADRNSLHALNADYAYSLNGNRSIDTYMNIEKIIKIAVDTGVDAIHPGYGFLSEREKFARAVENAGITFIGPSSSVISMLGDKVAARKLMRSIGIPIVPGSKGAISEFSEAYEVADKIGYPVLIKAVAGGGGMGMKVARQHQELEQVLKNVQTHAESVFGDGAVFIEKYLERPRHIEVQILSDKHGNTVHLGERECSIQRRHQKIVEETPSSIITPEVRKKMGEMAAMIAKSVNYQSAGTVEFIYEDGEFYFLEMNTRIQVEHTITEMITGIDIVKSQIKIAAGEPLEFKQDDIMFNGHAIECRICAEDPLNKFMPSPGLITNYSCPCGFGVRIDSGVHLGYEISTHYDSLISKLVSWGNDREEAIARMHRALSEYEIIGPKTNIQYLRTIMRNNAFRNGNISTKFIDEQPHLFDEARMLTERSKRTI
jgi:pyruvate carboxylase subunit A